MELKKLNERWKFEAKDSVFGHLIAASDWYDFALLYIKEKNILVEELKDKNFHDKLSDEINSIKFMSQKDIEKKRIFTFLKKELAL